MSSIVQKAGIRVVLLAGMLLGMDQLYRHVLFPRDLAEHTPIMEQVRAARDRAEVVYLGESSNFTFQDEDADKRSISQFAAEYFPTQRWATIQQGALHAGQYRQLLRNIPADAPLETVVVTLNLRSFDATWIHSKLETSLQKSMVLARPGPPLWRRFQLSFRAFDRKTEAERAADRRAQWLRDTLEYPLGELPGRTVPAWDSAVGERGVPGPDGKRSDFLTSLATQYVKTYAFQIDTLTNPRIRDFDGIVELCRDRGWKLVLLLLPENVTRAGDLVPELPWFMRQNRDVLVARYRRAGAVVVDLLELLPNADFSDQDWTTEHYGEAGRKQIARRLAEAMQPWYPEKFRNVVYQKTTPRIFVNDCEGDKIWGQMGSLTDGRAHSGRKSSRIGKDRQFSLTFSRAVPDLDTNYRDSVAVSFWLYQEDLAHRGSIALEAGGDATGYLWDTTAMHRFNRVQNQWTKLEARLPLWPQLPEAEVMKIYLYNPSEKWIWVDDLRIEFLGR